MSKAHLLELLNEGFWRRDVVQSATLAALRTRPALTVPMNATPIFRCSAAIVPRPDVPLVEEQPVIVVPVAEVMMLE